MLHCDRWALSEMPVVDSARPVAEPDTPEEWESLGQVLRTS